jgi:hypothetical protein
MPTTVQNSDILDAMADQIRAAVVAVTDIDVQVEPRMVNSPTPPTIDMYPGDTSRGTESAAFGLEGEFLFTVRARVSGNDVDAQQDLLLAFMDDVNALSIPMALLEDTTLGGLVADLSVRDPTGFVLYPYGEQSLVGFQFTCVVIRGDS